MTDHKELAVRLREAVTMLRALDYPLYAKYVEQAATEFDQNSMASIIGTSAAQQLAAKQIARRERVLAEEHSRHALDAAPQYDEATIKARDFPDAVPAAAPLTREQINAFADHLKHFHNLGEQAEYYVECLRDLALAAAKEKP